MNKHTATLNFQEMYTDSVKNRTHLRTLNRDLLAVLEAVLPYLSHMGPIFDNPELECGDDCPRCRAEAAIAQPKEEQG